MRKNIIFALVLAFAGPVYAQSSPETMSRIRDNMTPTAVADVTQLGGTQAAANWGLNVAAGCYYASAGTWYSWSGALANSDAVAPATTRAPYVQGLGLYFDGANWRRVTGETWDTTIANTVAPETIALNAFYDTATATGYRWQGEPYDSSMTAAPTNPGVNAYTAFYNGANGQYWQGSQMNSETTANTNYAPFVKNYNYCYDATSASWRWVNVINTQADGQAATLNGTVTSSIAYGYNGATFDLMRVGASNELQTTDVATRPGEDAANDYRKVKQQSIYTYAPAATTGTAVAAGAGLTIVLAAVEILDLTNVTLFLKNTDGGGAAFTDAEVSVSPNNSDWVSLTWTDCDTLADGSTCVYSISGNSYRYVRARVASAADITVSAWIAGNNG